MRHPIVALSPMADMTDSPFCRIVKTMAHPIIFREMISSEAIMRGNKKTVEMTDIHESEHPIIQQIFGSDPKIMAEAAHWIVEEKQPDGIDINMGCPARKIISNFNGSALMKDPETAAAIVQAVVKAVSVPVSVKMRTGWSDPNECLTFAKIIEEAGAHLISIHGRTQAQGYAGLARRDVIAQVKANAKIPILYNGDIQSAEDFFKAIEETGCDGALIGRGALGNPWIFQEIESRLRGESITAADTQERFRVIRAHLDLHLTQYGERAIPSFRKHLLQYLKGLPEAKSWRMKLVEAKTKEEIHGMLGAYQASLDLEAKAQ